MQERSFGTDLIWHEDQQEPSVLVEQMKELRRRVDRFTGPHFDNCMLFVGGVAEEYYILPTASEPQSLKYKDETHRMQVWKYKKFTLIYSFNNDKVFVSFGEFGQVDPKNDVTTMDTKLLIVYIIQTLFGEYATVWKFND